MMFFFLAIAIAYVVIGIIHGIVHTLEIHNSLRKLQVEEDYLREMVRTYELTPSGAEYYAKLQELYISNAEYLQMLRGLEKAPKGYIIQSFLISLIFWPYYIFSIGNANKKANIEQEDGR